MASMPWRYDLRLLSYLVAIAEEGSVSGAARRLNLSQPTVSRQLRELEQRLGVDLFVRSGRGLTPTTAGAALLQRATRVLAEADALLNDVRLAAQGLTGRLTIGFTASAIHGALGRVLGRFRTELPDVDLRLVEVFDDVELTAGVVDGTFDVSVQRLPIHDTRLAGRAWIREPLSLFLPAAHPLAKRRDPAPVTVLGDLPLILWPREASPRAYDEVLALCTRAGVVPRIGAEARTVQTILALAAAGFGGAVMADSYRVLHREGVVARRLAGTTTVVYLVWRKDDANPLLARFWAIVNATALPGDPEDVEAPARL